MSYDATKRVIQRKSEQNVLSGADSTSATYLSDFCNLATRIKLRVSDKRIVGLSAKQIGILEQVEKLVKDF